MARVTCDVKNSADKPVEFKDANGKDVKLAPGKSASIEMSAATAKSLAESDNGIEVSGVKDVPLDELKARLGQDPSQPPKVHSGSGSV